ncbi:MAG: hypothetical protein KA423_00350 [Candidatus Planktophila sp.]|nr:hypothetical protein [Candidatus Planktophila sp.]MBP7902697.1 hypothetical protein [Candidatus Planktophila sp.]
MRNRALQLAAAFTAVILFSNVLSFNTKSNRYSESYPAVVCPPNQASQSSVIALTSPKIQLRRTGVATMAFKDSRTRRFAGSTQATVIDAQSITPMMWQVRTGVWAGGLTCLAPVTSQWFVGATADVTSKGTLTLVNSGLGRALVGVTVYTENGVQAEQNFAVKANSFISAQLATLAPGAKSIAVHVVPQTGRINAFVTDERGRGLQALGGDTVNSQESAVKSLVIPAIPQQTGRNTSLPHTLRVLIPGEVGAPINVEIRSTDGTFSPAGIDGKVIPGGKVVDLPLDVLMESGKFALHLTSERPFVASVFTKTQAQGKSDFLWSTPVPALVPGTFATTGLAPLLVFTGGDIAIDIEVTSIKGSKRKVELRGNEIVTYQVSERIRAFTIIKSSEKTYGAALITSKSGFGYAPLVTGSALTRTSIPRSNIRVLIP